MDPNYDLLLAINNEEVFAPRYKAFGYSTMDELKVAISLLGQLGYVASNNLTQSHGILFGAPGESLDVRITQLGINALHKAGRI